MPRIPPSEAVCLASPWQSHNDPITPACHSRRQWGGDTRNAPTADGGIGRAARGRGRRMEERQAREQAYLLRLWQEDEGALWRASLLVTETGARRAFGSL